MSKRIRIKDLYLPLLSLYIIAMVFGDSNFSKIQAIDSIVFLIKIIVLFGLSVIIIGIGNISNKKYLFLLFGIIIINVVAMIRNGMELNILNLVLLIFASEKINMKKIFKTFLITYIVCTIVVIISSQIGIIEDTINIRYSLDSLARLLLGTEKYERHSLGFQFSNQVPFSLLSIYLISISMKQKNLKMFWHIIIQGLNILFFYTCGSRSTFVLVILTTLLYWIAARKENTLLLKLLSKVAKYMYPILTILCFTAVNILYDRLPYWLNAFSNFRFTYAKRTIDYYGIHLLGSGFEAGTVKSAIKEYAVLDNGYLMLLVQRGILLGILVIILWTLVSIIAAKKKNVFLLLSLVVIALANLIDYHILSYRFIPFMIILFHSSDPTISPQVELEIKPYKHSLNINKRGIRI